MRILTALLVVAVVIASLSVGYIKSQEAFTEKQRLDQEIFLKISAEEALEKAKLEIKSLKNDLTVKDQQIASTKKLLEQTTKLNSELEARVKKAMDSRSRLEEQLATMKKVTIKNMATVNSEQ